MTPDGHAAHPLDKAAIREPFAGESEAMAFIDRHGGRVAALSDIPDAAVFGHFDLPLLPEDPA